MGRSPRVLVVGYHAFDTIVQVDRLPAPDTKQVVAGFFEGGGGPGATAAVALARLGAEVAFLGALTDDHPGRVQRGELEAAGVDLSPSPVLPGYASPRAVILVLTGSGERTILWSRGDLPPLDRASARPDLLDGRDMLYTDGHDTAAALALAREARLRGLPVVMDAGGVREGSRELVAHCTDVLSSRRFAPDLTGREDPVAALREMRALGPDRVALTWGEHGVLGLEGDRPFAVPAFVVDVRDTTGAGDAFHAGYARARLDGRSFRECLAYGAAVAALGCRGWGGRRALPSADETAGLLVRGHRRPLGPLAPYGEA